MPSPIETALRAALLERCPTIRDETSVVGVMLVGDENLELHPSADVDRGELSLFAQVRCVGYKLDLCLWSDGIGLGIECDGFDFHDRTPQQAAYDRARDRELIRACLTVIRFAGTEIYRDPDRCANEVMWTWDAVANKLNRLIARADADALRRSQAATSPRVEEH